MNNKISKVVVGMTLGLVLLTGCAVPDSGSSSIAGPGPVASAPAAPAADADSVYYNDVVGLLKGTYPRKSIIEFGHTVCSALGRGMTFNQFSSAVSQSGMIPYDAGILAGGAVADLCPEYTSIIKSWTDAASA